MGQVLHGDTVRTWRGLAINHAPNMWYDHLRHRRCVAGRLHLDMIVVGQRLCRRLEMVACHADRLWTSYPRSSVSGGEKARIYGA